MDLKQAAALERAGQIEAAAAAFTSLLDGKTATQARFGLARLARARGAHEEALALFATIAEAEPDSIPALSGRAQALRALGNATQAESAFRDVLKLAPAHKPALLALGEILLARGEAESALPLLVQAASGEGTRRAGLRRQAEALRRLGGLQEARAVLDTLLDEAPDDTQARLSRARLRREQGALDEARADLRELLAGAPNEAVFIEAGLTERAAGDAAAARNAFESARAASPGSARPLLELAIELRAAGDIDGFESLVMDALRMAGSDQAVLCRIADQALAAGTPDVALALLEAALRAMPDSPLVEMRACEAMARLGQAEAALSRLDSLAARAGKRPEIHLRRIAALQMARPPAEALDYARDCCAAFPAHAELWRHRIKLELRLSPEPTLQAALDAMPARSTAERAVQARLRGQAALRAFRLAEASDHLASAAALAASDAGICEDRLLTALLRMNLDAAMLFHERHTVLMQPLRLMKGHASEKLADFYGHVLRAYAEDPLAEGIRDLADIAPSGRALSLTSLVRSAPDSIVPAVMLAIAWRQAGVFAAAPVRGSSPITGPIVQYWDSADIPADVRALMASFAAHNPGRRHEIFDDARARAYLASDHAPDVLAAYDAAEEAAQKSDLFRLAFLAANGGIYADADDLCTAPLDALLGDACFVAYQERYGTIANNFLACVPQHPVILAALEGAIDALLHGGRDMIWLQTGPGLITRSLARIVACTRITPAAWFARCRILQPWEMEQAVSAHRPAQYKRGARHWHHAAFGRQAPRFAPVADVLRA